METLEEEFVLFVFCLLVVVPPPPTMNITSHESRVARQFSALVTCKYIFLGKLFTIHQSSVLEDLHIPLRTQTHLSKTEVSNLNNEYRNFSMLFWNWYFKLYHLLHFIVHIFVSLPSWPKTYDLKP